MKNTKLSGYSRVIHSSRALSGLRSIAKLGIVLLLMIHLLACAAQKKDTQPDVPKKAPDVEHRVSYSGETLGLIARWYTGKTSNWTAVRDYNPGLQPERINIGQVIQIPGDLVTQRDPLPERVVSALATKKKAPPKASDEDASSAGRGVEPALSPEDDEASEEASADSEPATDDAAAEAEIAELLEGLEAEDPPAVEAEPAAEENSDKTAAADTNGGEDGERERLLDELLAE